METPEPYESFINRQTPEIPVGLFFNGEKQAVLLRYDNTLIVTHDEEYKQFDHLMIYGLTPVPIYIWKTEDEWPLLDVLREYDFDEYYRKYPSLDDEEMWMTHQRVTLEQELKDL